MSSLFTHRYLTNGLADYLSADLPPASGFPIAKLAKAPFTPTPTMSDSDVVHADFTGYTSKAFNYSLNPRIDSNGQAIVTADALVSWTPTGTGVSNTIYGWVLEDMNGDVIAAGNFSTPILMAGPANVIQLQMTLGFASPRLSATLLP